MDCLCQNPGVNAPAAVEEASELVEIEALKKQLDGLKDVGPQSEG